MSQPVHIASFNAENFYLLLDGQMSREEVEALDDQAYLAMNRSIFNPNKERTKIAEIATIILESDFDLVGLCEVGGLETLAAFNRLYLHDRYRCFLHEENSRRGIFVGALVKRGRFLHVQAHNMGGAFSRNLLRVDVGTSFGTLTMFVVHLKSQHGADQGLEQRIREVERLSGLVRHRQCVLMGDFNGILIRGEHQFEYEPILALPFRDVLEAVGIPPDQRRTHYYFGRSGPNFTQLDYIFCSDDLEVVEAGVIEGEIPLNMQQRRTLPSDHLFIHAKIRLGNRDSKSGGLGAASAGDRSLDKAPSEKPKSSKHWWLRLFERWFGPRL